MSRFGFSAGRRHGSLWGVVAIAAAMVGLAAGVSSPAFGVEGVHMLSVNDVTVAENAGTADFTVTMNVTSPTPVTVQYATNNGSALAGSDYTVSGGTLTFVAGDTSETITVPVLDDSVGEPTETFTVVLSNPDNATISDGTGIGTITDNDSSVSISDVSQAEGTGASSTFAFTVTRAGATTGTATVDYATSPGTAAAGDDYTTTNGTVTFVPGDTTETVNVTVSGDAFAEPNETFSVVLSNPSGVTIADSAGTGTIVNDDGTAPSLAIDDVTVAEGNAGTADATFTVTRTNGGGTNQTVTVDYTTQNDTAVAPGDYVTTSGTLTFGPADTTEQITVQVNGDTKNEITERFFVVLSNALNATVSDASGQGSIIDNDAVPTLSIADMSQAEGTGGTSNAVLTVSLSAASGRQVSVDFSTSQQTATANTDYTPQGGTLIFNEGDTAKTITVPLATDSLDEADETFAVNLSNPTNATISDPTGVGTITDDDPFSALSIADASTITEGNSGTADQTFTVTLSPASGQTVTVQYATADDTATAPGDYTTTSGGLTFAPGETSKTVTVAVVGETTDEANLEQYFVNLSAATNASVTDGQAVGPIMDNDGAPVLSIDNQTVAEGAGSAVFTVTLAPASGQTVTVDYSTVAGTATAGSDYTPASGTLTFDPGQTTKTITVPILQDSVDEADETYTVQLANPTNASLGTANGNGVITDDDAAPSLSVNDPTAINEGNSGSTPITFSVSMSAASERTVTVSYATADATATAPSDYTAASGALTFAPGETDKTVNVSVIGDTNPEFNETFALNLSAPTNAALNDAQGVGGITNDDGPPAEISIDDVTVTEGNTGTANASFTVSLDAAAAADVTVHFATADGTATQPADYTSNSGDLTFTPGQTQKTVTVEVVGDTLDEVNETFTVDLTNPSANAVITDAQGLGTITDDDGPPALSVNDVIVTEGNTGTTDATFTVSLSAESGKTITVHYATADATATEPGDYTATSGDLTFAAGETSKTVAVPVKGDTVDEATETFTLALSTPTNATIADGSGTGTITDDDGPPALSVNDVTVTEGNSGTTGATFTVSLSAASGQTITVHYATSDATATEPGDYTATSGDLTFAAGDTSETFTVPVVGETIDEVVETFSVGLSAPINATIADGSGTGTITDDDGPPALSVNDVTVTEGNSGTVNATFTVTKAGATSQTVTVQYATADGTATQPGDYTSASGDLSFAPGETTKTFTVPVVGDTVDEPNETFAVTLSAPTNATLADASGTGTITDDDAGPTLSVANQTVTEGDSGTVNATFTVTKSGPTSQTVTVHYATADGTATQPGDYTSASGELSFAPGETTKTFTVAVKGDTVDEVNEAFTVTLSAPTNATIDDDTGLGTITDDDAAASLSINDVSVTEGNSGTVNATLTVTKSGATEQTVTVHFATADGTANQPSDYTATSGDLTFAPGETTKTIAVPVKGDTANEPNETFTVELSAPANATISDATGTATIANDDTTLSIDDVTVTEGNSGTVNATFTVTKTGTTGQTVTVHYATADGPATQPGDYTAASGDLSFAPADTTKTVTVAVMGDALDEVNETFTVNLSAPVNTVLADAQGVGTITDDDAVPALSVSDASVTEGNSGTANATFTVTLSAASGQTVTVHHATSDGTATQPGDYAAASGDLSFAPGETTKTFVVAANGDTSPEANETFTVTLSAPTNATISDATGTGTITNDDAVPQIATGAGQGGGPHVALFSGGGGAAGGFFAYDPGFPGGVRVARGDLDGDGKDEVVTAPGAGRSPTIRVFRTDGSLVREFNAYDPGFQGGVFVAVGDVTGDATPEIITGAGAGGGPHVRVFDAAGGSLAGWFAYAPSFTGGVSVGVGDINNAGKAEIVTGAGAGGGPHVRAFDGAGAGLASFFAYAPSFTGGVFVAAGGGRIVTGPGAGGGPHVRTFDGTGAAQGGGFMAYEPGFSGGVRVAVGDIDNVAGVEIVTGPGAGGGPHVRGFKLDGTALGGGFFAYAPSFTGGVYPAVGRA